jgi:hypothetical protein
VNWRSKLAKGLLLLIAAAVAARVVWELLGPLLPSLLALLVIGSLILWLVRGPHAGR